MKLGTEECVEALKGFKTKDEFEELGIELLLIPENDNETFAKFTIKLCDHKDDKTIRKVELFIKRIRKKLGIED